MRPADHVTVENQRLLAFVAPLKSVSVVFGMVRTLGGTFSE